MYKHKDDQTEAHIALQVLSTYSIFIRLCSLIQVFNSRTESKSDAFKLLDLICSRHTRLTA